MKIDANTKLDKLPAGRHSAGFNTYLQVSKTGARSWVMIWRDQTGPRIDGIAKQREFGLGSASIITYQQAVGLALDMKRKMILDRTFNPITVRATEKKAAEQAVTLFSSFLKDVVVPQRAKELNWKGGVDGATAKRWSADTERLAQAIWNKRVADVSKDDVIDALEPIWHAKSETARKVQQVISATLDAAIRKGLHKGPNPAALDVVRDAIGGQLKLTRDEKAERSHKGLTVERTQWLMQQLLQSTEMKALATAFCILNINRTAEATGARWTEIDFKAGAWIIPGSRMKNKSKHVIPLSTQALDILTRLHNVTGGGEFVFASAKTKFGHLWPADVRLTMRRLGVTADEATAHGMRGTFGNWCRDNGENAEAREISLSHAVGDDTVHAYTNSPMFAQRKALNQRYADAITAAPAAHLKLAA
jgi:integrase